MGESLKKYVFVLLMLSLIVLFSYRKTSKAVTIDYDFIKERIDLEKERIFPLPDSLKPRVEFWKKVFTFYDSSQIIIHDALHPNNIYWVIDSPGPPKGPFDSFTDEEQETIDLNEDYLQTILYVFHDIENNKKRSFNGWPSERVELYRQNRSIVEKTHNFFSSGFDEKIVSDDEFAQVKNLINIYNLVSKLQGKDRFLKAAHEKRIRAQRGKRDHFESAIFLSGFYRKKIQDILSDHGLPVWLWLLPFQESMFNFTAKSSDGALGIWQFMRNTAKQEKLKVRPFDLRIDERMDPFASTVAAARKFKNENELLLRRIKKLGIPYNGESLWPLNITGHNYGIYGVIRAIEKLKSLNIDDVVFDYRSRSKGFAVENFYTQFIAILDVYEERKTYFPEVEPAPDCDYGSIEIQLSKSTSFKSIAGEYGIDQGVLHFLNPSLNPRNVYNDIPFPKGTKITIPVALDTRLKDAILLAYNEHIFDDEWNKRFEEYVVAPGDTLSFIAYKFGISVKTLMAHNNLKTSRIYPKSILAIPSE